MEPVVLSEPWGLLDRDGLVSKRLVNIGSGCGQVTVNGSGTPRVVVEANQTALLRCGRRRLRLPLASFPFSWGGATLRACSLPLDLRAASARHCFSSELELGSQTIMLDQVYTPGRPSAAMRDEVSVSVENWIAWQVNSFQELAHIEEVSSKPGSLDEHIHHGPVRRNWDAVQVQWERSGRDDARMALIVRLAADSELRAALDGVSRRPRRVLERVRSQTSLGRIQELDSACIRSFAGRPGITPAEKAGSRQELLAVRRNETIDTLENRVAKWVCAAMIELAREYERTNQRHLETERCRAVRRLRHDAQSWQVSEVFKSVHDGALVHPVVPNYPLQSDTRYRKVFRAYREIRREHEAADDAWEWMRTLWSETSRQLVICALLAKYTEAYSSVAYFRTESERGRWTEAPVAPGPFSTPLGHLEVLDCRDLESLSDQNAWQALGAFHGGQHVGAWGCDQMLVWPHANKALAIWHLFDACDGEDSVDTLARAGAALRTLTDDIVRFERQHLTLRGVIVRPHIKALPGEKGVEVSTWPEDSRPEIVQIMVPTDAHAHLAEFHDWLEVAIDEVAR